MVFILSLVRLTIWADDDEKISPVKWFQYIEIGVISVCAMGMSNPSKKISNPTNQCFSSVCSQRRRDRPGSQPCYMVVVVQDSREETRTTGLQLLLFRKSSTALDSGGVRSSHHHHPHHPPHDDSIYNVAYMGWLRRVVTKAGDCVI